MAVSKSSPLILNVLKKVVTRILYLKEIDNGAVNKLLDDKFIRKTKLNFPKWQN